jgi:hypothetical protein
MFKNYLVFGITTSQKVKFPDVKEFQNHDLAKNFETVCKQFWDVSRSYDRLLKIRWWFWVSYIKWIWQIDLSTGSLNYCSCSWPHVLLAASSRTLCLRSSGLCLCSFNLTQDAQGAWVYDSRQLEGIQSADDRNNIITHFN